MSKPSLEQLKYPIGPFGFQPPVAAETLASWIDAIALFPSRLDEAIANMPQKALEWPYRPKGWNIRQVIHHCADSHINALIRIKLALTEEQPTIKPYAEHLWAELPDMMAPIEESLWILKGLHSRWERLLRNLGKDHLQKTFVHPEHGKVFTLEEAIAMYAWHSNHHLAHVKQALAYRGEF